MTDAQLEHLLALDNSPGPALAIDAAHADALIEAALDGAGFLGGGGGGGGGGSGAGASGSAAGVKLAIGAAVLAAAVAVVLFLARRGGGHEQEAAVTPPDAALPDAAVAGGGGGGGSATAIAPPVDAPDPEIEITPEPDRPDRPDRPAKPQPSAADLLGEANAKRMAKQWREADALYAKVVDRAPKGLAAQSALISSATIRLEHLGDPKGAAQRFRRVLAMAPNGALAEDARWGIAEAARATGNTKAEAAALDDFLAHHAGSALAARAKARREELR